MSRILETAWYRFRATFGRQWGGYLTVLVLIGLLGGLAMGAVAGARRTLASPSVYVASRNPFSFGIGTAVFNPEAGHNSGYDPSVIDTMAHLPSVAAVVSQSGLNVVILDKRGIPVPLDANAGNGTGSIDGAYFTYDKASVLEGRMPDPDNPREFVVNFGGAQSLGLHVGQVVPFGIYTNAQTELPGFGTASVPPYRRLDIKLVGIIEDPGTVAADQADIEYLQVFSPALTRQLLSCCANYTVTGLKVDGGSAVVHRVEQEAQAAVPAGDPVILTAPTSDLLAKAVRSVKPLAIALAVFGGIAGLVALIVAAQLVGRQLRFGLEERRVLRALGAGPSETILDGLLGLLMAIVVGSVLAAGVAVALSPIAPLGVIRPVYPDPGVAWDWTVLGTGFAILVVGLTVIASGMAYRQSPARWDRRGGRVIRSESTSAGVVAGWGFPAPAVEGVRFALDPGGGRDAVPVRSAILGTMLALWVVVTTVTFGTSLNALVSHPDLYGWNWDYALVGGSGSGDIPSAQLNRLIEQDHSVASWSGAYFASAKIDDQTVPVLGERAGAPVEPPILSGQALMGNDEVVLGPQTLSQLGKKVGDTVDVDAGRGGSTRLRIVGTATMPSIGSSGELHLEMGSGALIPSGVMAPADRNPFDDPATGPEAVFVRLKPGVDNKTAVASLQRIANATTTPSNFGVAISAVLRPAEIVNYRSMGTTPLLLGVSLAVAAVAALGLTLVASVRRRRRDLAVFKTLGFTRRQLAATVAWQSSVSVAIGVVVGVPLGIISGRLLWDLFATEINAVPSPTVPVGWVVAIGLGSLVLANLVAALPGRMAARTPTARVLRAD
jgi:hypothetical protein